MRRGVGGLLLLLWSCTGPNPAYEVTSSHDVGDGAGGEAGSGGSGGSGGQDASIDLEPDATTPDLRQVPDAAPPADLLPDRSPDLPLDLPPDLPPDRAPDLPIDAPVPVGTGLWGDYYDGSGLELGDTGELDETVRDDVIDHVWGTAAPHPQMDDDWFSVRWRGKIMPRHSQTYTFRVVADDGVRLWIDDQLLVDSWVAQTTATHTGTITLQAYQQYSIKVEYFEQTGNAEARLYWSSPSQPDQIVPRTCLFPP